MGICLVLMPKAPDYRPFVYGSIWVYAEIVFASCFNNVAQIFFTYTNQNASPATVGLIAYSGVMYNFLVDALIFKLQLVPMQILGVLIALTFSVAAAVFKMKTDGKYNKV